MADAVVIGAGPNGLVAANVLADAGWEVVVLEAEPEPGGAVRSAELTLPGFTHDRFSGFYPLAAASPHFRRLELERYGLRWRRAPVVVADPDPDGSAALLSSDLAETCASLDAFAPGDGAAWRDLSAWWGRVGPAFLRALLAPFPPLRGGARLAATLGSPRALLDFGRFGVLPARRFAEERFRGAGAARLIAGSAMHADVGPETPGGALYGMVLIGLGEQVGWPVPEGGAGRLTAALVARLEAAGGRVVCGERVDRVIVRGGRAVAVRCADGREVDARRAVLADVGAPQLYRSLLERDARAGPGAGARSSASSTTPAPSRSTGRSTARSPGPRRASRGRGPSTSPAGSTRSRSTRRSSPAARSRPSRSCSSASTRTSTRPASPRGRRRRGPTRTCPSTSAATPAGPA